MNYEERLQDLLDELDLFQDWTERYEYIISLGKKLPRLDEAYKTEDSLIKGCQSRVWLHTEPDNGVLLKKAAGIASGSGEPNKKKVATLSKAKLMEVVNTKLPDLNTKDPERAARILAGQARQMGIEVEGM